MAINDVARERVYHERKFLNEFMGRNNFVFDHRTLKPKKSIKNFEKKN